MEAWLKGVVGHKDKTREKDVFSHQGKYPPGNSRLRPEEDTMVGDNRYLKGGTTPSPARKKGPRKK